MAKQKNIYERIGCKKIKQQYNNVEYYPTLNHNFLWNITNFGQNNDVPQQILNLINTSTTSKSIIRSKVTYICGNGVKGKHNGQIGQPNLFENWSELIEKIAKDYTSLGAYALQIIVNKDYKTFSIYHTDVSQVRVGEYDENTGDVYSYGICRNWNMSTMFQPVFIKAWGSEEPVIGERYLFYYCDYNPSMDFYGLPEFWAALQYMEAESNLGIFYNTLIKNNFNPSSIIMFPSNPDDKTKQKILDDLEAFSGPSNTSNIMAIWANGNEKPDFAKLDSTNVANQYQQAQEKIEREIIKAHRVSSPTLLGIPGSGSLSGNANEIVNGFTLFNLTVINDYRNDILRTLNKFQIMNGRDELEIEDFNLVKDIAAGEAAGKLEGEQQVIDDTVKKEVIDGTSVQI